MNLLLTLSCWVYFAGDNLHNSVQGNEKIRIASVTLLFIGLTGFRLIPALKEAIDEKEADDDIVWLSAKGRGQTNDDIDWSCSTMIKMLHLVPEIDGWFTQVTALIALAETSDASVICIDDGSANVSATDDGPICAGDYVAVMWIIYIFIVVLSLIEAVVQFQISKDEVIDLEDYKCYSNRDKKYQEKIQFFLKFFLLFSMPVMVTLFLIGDNSHPLDWTVECISSKSKADNIIRIVAVFVSLAVYIILLFFYIKEKWNDIEDCWKEIKQEWSNRVGAQGN